MPITLKSVFEGHKDICLTTLSYFAPNLTQRIFPYIFKFKYIYRLFRINRNDEII